MSIKNPKYMFIIHYVTRVSEYMLVTQENRTSLRNIHQRY